MFSRHLSVRLSLTRRPIFFTDVYQANSRATARGADRRSLWTTGTNLSDQNHQRSVDQKSFLLSQPERHVMQIELNRPKSKNSLSLESAREFIELLQAFEDDTSVRCLLLTGHGDQFTSGVDIGSFMSSWAKIQEIEDPARKAKLVQSLVLKFQAPFKRMYSFSKPIICVAHGICYGLGMEFAACSDIRYCTRDTKVSIREVLIGIAADVGSLQLLPKLMANQSLLRELIYTGRDFTPDELTDLAFFSRVCDNKEEAMNEALKTAKLIASRSPVAVQGSKRNLQFSSDKSFLDGMDYNAVWNMSMLQSSDVAAAIGALMSKSDKVQYEDY